jgi:copper(I)-binding protein
MKKLTLLAAGLIFSAGVFAAAADDVVVQEPYVRLAPPNAVATGAFMVFQNPGAKMVKILKVESPVAKVSEMHTHLNEAGVMKMRPVAAIEIPANGEVVLKPGSLHVMLIDLKAALKEGESVPLTFSFDDGSTKKIEAKVVRPQPMQHKHH